MLVGLVCAGYTYANKFLAENETNIAYAIWCKAESSLIFLQSGSEIKEGDVFQGHAITKLWKSDEVTNTGENEPGWRTVVNRSLVKVVFDETFKTATPTSTYQWFWECKKLEIIEGIENLNTSEVTTMRAMFSECENLKNLDVRGFNTSKVRIMQFMFANCYSLTRLDVKSFDTKNVEDMQGMFYGCSGLKEIDLNNFVTENVTNMSDMFRGCSDLTFLDLYSFNTSRVNNMTRMFYECTKLTGIDVSSFITSSVREMPWMFYGCKSLTQLDVSNFDTRNVVNMRTAFGECHELRLLDLDNWETDKVENMRSLFFNCVKLSTLKLAKFNTESVKEMSLMFYKCGSLDVLDLSKFNTNNVEAADSMFFYNRELHSIFVGDGWEISKSASSANMFFECIKIVGENGTTYNSKYVDGIYARVDKEGYPGYFRTSALTVKPILTLTCSEGGWMEFMGEKVSGYTKSFVIDRGADIKVEYGARRGYKIDEGPSFIASSGTAFGFNSHECSVYGMTKDVIITLSFKCSVDLNGDGKVDIADAVTVLNIMAASEYNEVADVNGDQKVDIADFVSVLNIMAEQ